MIKVIKHGEKKKFTATCPDCGCEFEYELEDLKVDYSRYLATSPGQYRRNVLCPECNKKIYHDTVSEGLFNGDSIISLTGDKTTFINEHPDACENCPYKDGPKDVFGNPTVGDSPCQWCPHYKWKVTFNCAKWDTNK